MQIFLFSPVIRCTLDISSFRNHFHRVFTGGLLNLCAAFLINMVIKSRFHWWQLGFSFHPRALQNIPYLIPTHLPSASVVIKYFFFFLKHGKNQLPPPLTGRKVGGAPGAGLWNWTEFQLLSGPLCFRSSQSCSVTSAVYNRTQHCDSLFQRETVCAVTSI